MEGIRPSGLSPEEFGVGESEAPKTEGQSPWTNEPSRPVEPVDQPAGQPETPSTGQTTTEANATPQPEVSEHGITAEDIRQPADLLDLQERMGQVNHDNAV